MQRFLCGRLVLILIGIIGLLQLIHIILLNRLESRQHKNENAPQPVFGQSSLSHGDEHQVNLIFQVLFFTLSLISIYLSCQQFILCFFHFQINEEVSLYAAFIDRNWVLDTSGEYHLSLLQPYFTDVAGQTQDITLVTQCSQDHLADLVPLVQQWKVCSETVSLFVNYFYLKICTV